LTRRQDIALALLESHPELARAYGVAIYFCLLEDLTSRGPFAPIFRAVDEPELQVDWLGKGQDTEAGQ
jgi:hypothetical protein